MYIHIMYMCVYNHMLALSCSLSLIYIDRVGNKTIQYLPIQVFQC